MNKIKFSKISSKNIPEQPGIYIFYNKKGRPIYIGKSANLKNRVSSYFSANLGPKTANMVSEANQMDFIEVTSELESLLLEAKLVRKERPKYNIQLKDDKHPLYIKISKEKYPRVLTARKIDENEKNIAFFGPFPSSKNVRLVLKLLRKIFPFAQHKEGKKPCLYSQIGLCVPCPSKIENTRNTQKKKALKKEYMSNIRSVKTALSGRLSFVKKDLEKKMKIYAKEEKYEEAKTIKSKIDGLNYITQPIIPSEKYLENPNLAEDIRAKELSSLKNILDKKLDKNLSKLERIECYDVAHLKGFAATASMITFLRGNPDKTFYRHFKIKQEKTQSDTDSLAEVAQRRSKHLNDWGKPDLMIIDGGKAQVSLFQKHFSLKTIPIVGLAKRDESLIIKQKNKYQRFKVREPNALALLQRLRNEAHRFARRYHHNLIKKNLIPSK